MGTRLLSPNKSRIYPNARTGVGSPATGAREGLKQGEPDAMTWEGLVKSGWTEYDGPAVTDERGYLVAGSDPERGL